VSWFLRRSARLVLACGVVVVLQLMTGGAARAGYGGGYGGTSGDGIWALAWWLGNPSGGGPYVGPPASAQGQCIWIDAGPTVKDLGDALGQSGLPASFWTVPQGGGHPQIWGVLRWAVRLAQHSSGTDHFDLVACPKADQVPPSGGDVESDLPLAHPLQGPPMWLWILWDTVPDPPPGSLPPVLQEMYRSMALPSPVISISPSRVGGIPNSTAVNVDTWLWLSNGGIFDHSVVATASAGPYTATVWAYPVSVTWSAGWDFTEPSLDPQRGTNLAPESLNTQCDGPGVAYPYVSGACTAVFTQSTLGGRAPLTADVAWSVHWAISEGGVVGGEGTFDDLHTQSRLWLRVVQVESIISSG
jgi:hypothetical protein